MDLKRVIALSKKVNISADTKKEIEKARADVEKVKQHNQTKINREGMLMSKILHAVTTMAVEAMLPYDIAKRWIQAIARDELPKFTGLELIAEVGKFVEEMREQLPGVNVEKEKRKIQLDKVVKDWEPKQKEKLLSPPQYPEACDEVSKHQSLDSPFLTRAFTPSFASPSFSTVTTVCDNCKKRGHDIGDCWQLDPEQKSKALKTLRKHKCNRCGKFGHHENGCWDAFPEKRAAAMKWRAAQRNGQRG